jgi:type VI protein secretion system component Hcp
MKTLIPLAVLFSLGTLVPAAPPSRAAAAISANAITVRIDGIAEPISATSFAFGAARIPGQTGSGGPRDGQTVYKQLLINREVDQETTKLVKALMEAKVLRFVEVRQGNLRIRIDNAVIADYNLQGSAGRDGARLESLSLEFADADLRVDP